MSFLQLPSGSSAALLLGLLSGSAAMAQNPEAPPKQVSSPGDQCDCSDNFLGRCKNSWKKCYRRVRDGFAGKPELFREPEHGTFVNDHALTQINNGIGARMVLYHYDFVDGSDQLTERGRDQLAKIIRLLDHHPGPIVIERTPREPTLDLNRRFAIYNELKHAAVIIDLNSVVVGVPRAVGLHTAEAEILQRNLLSQTQSGGSQRITPSGGGTGSASPSSR